MKYLTIIILFLFSFTLKGQIDRNEVESGKYYDIEVYVKCHNCKIDKIEYLSYGLYHISNNFTEKTFKYKAKYVDFKIIADNKDFKYYIIIDNYRVLKDIGYNYLSVETLYNPVKHK